MNAVATLPSTTLCCLSPPFSVWCCCCDRRPWRLVPRGVGRKSGLRPGSPTTTTLRRGRRAGPSRCGAFDSNPGRHDAICCFHPQRATDVPLYTAALRQHGRRCIDAGEPWRRQEPGCSGRPGGEEGMEVADRDPAPGLRRPAGAAARGDRRADLAVGETVILLHPPLPLVGVSIAMERERQQNDSLADG